MKRLFFSLLFSVSVMTAFAQGNAPQTTGPDKAKPVLSVEAACGQCMLGLKGTGCDLAVRFDGQAYFVDGSDIDQHGDAHAKDGFCNAIRKAEAQGQVVDSRFKATYLKLVTEPTNK